MKQTIRVTINGRLYEEDVEPRVLLAHFLRENIGLTGTHIGCVIGECGACSVLLDGELVDACLVPICQVDGHVVRTVEGLAGRAVDGQPDLSQLDVVQSAFLETGGAQCGICTPGMLMAAHAFLASGADPTDEAIREAIAGNLCRCTGYTKIVDAIVLAAHSASQPPVE